MFLKNLFSSKRIKSNEPRFGLIYKHNNPESNVLILINNRDATFHKVKVIIEDDKKQQFEKTLNLQNKEAAQLQLEDFTPCRKPSLA